MSLERHYSAAELAALLSLDEETILRKARSGELRSVQIGRARRFPESSVVAWLNGEPQERTLAPVVDLRAAR